MVVRIFRAVLIGRCIWVVYIFVVLKHVLTLFVYYFNASTASYFFIQLQDPEESGLETKSASAEVTLCTALKSSSPYLLCIYSS